MRFALALFALACAEAPSPAPPAAELPPAAERPPASDDVARLVQFAEACFPEGAGPEVGPSFTAGEAGRWLVSYALADGRRFDFDVDALAGTCDGRALDLPAPAASRSLGAIVEVCWAEARNQRAGRGVGGSPLVRAPRLSLSGEHVIVDFPEETPTTLPSGQTLAYELRRGRCAPTIMD